MSSEQAPSQPPLAQHDSRLLDLAFGMDTTGSMSSYIRAACNNVRQIVEEIVAKESSDVRLALVEYRDHPPQDTSYVTQVHDFTPRVADMRQWLEASSADGGGDAPEAVADCLHQLLKLSWRPEATKICVLISDAPPHGLGGSGDGFPNGCPEGLDPMTLARQLAEKGVTLYVAGCEPALVPYKDFFTALAYITGGQYVPLQAAKALTPVIIGGAQEELSLEQFMDQVNQQVMAEVQSRGAEDVDVESLSRRVMAELNCKGARVQQLRVNKMVQAPLSAGIKSMSACEDMSEVRSRFSTAAYPAPPVPMADMLDECYERCPPPAEAMCSMVPPPPTRGSLTSPPGCGPPPVLPQCGSAPPPPPAAAGRRSRPTKKSALRSLHYTEDELCEAMAEDANEDVYDSVEGQIHLGQAERMVQKALMRSKISLSKK